MSVNVYEEGQLKTIAGKLEVVDNLNSTYANKALSANQGKILNENKLDIDLENIDESGIERIKEIAGESSVPENIVLHGPSEEEVEVPPIDADRLGGELPEYYAKQSDINATNQAVNNINVYVGEDSMLHFVNSEGADSVIPFSNGAYLDMVDNTAIPANYTFTEDYDLVMLSAWSSSGGDIIWTYNGQGLMSQKIGSAGNARSGYACLLINVKAGDTISRNKGDTTSCYKFKYVGGKPSPKQRFSRFEYLGDHTNTERTITAINGLKAVLGVIWNYGNTNSWNYYKNTVAQSPWALGTGGNNRGFSSCVITPLLEGDSISFPQASSQEWFWLGVY